MTILNLSPESQELIQELAKVNVSNIYTVRFFPNDRPSFNVMTKNMKKITIAITSKLWKTEFESNELKDIYEFIKTNLPNEIWKEKREIIETAVKDFITRWGKVIIVTKSSRVIRSIFTLLSTVIIVYWWMIALCWWIGWLLFWNEEQSLLIFVAIVLIIFHTSVITKMEATLKQESIDITYIPLIKRILNFISSRFHKNN